MKNICIIPARGGSKRILRKNIRPFLGRPIISYSIEAALESKLFHEVMVSTDDHEIAEIAKNLGANVPFLRSAETSHDHATTADVLLEVLQEYNEEFDNLCCLYPTAPFVTKEKLQQSYELFQNSKCDTLIPVTAFSFPPQRGLLIREGKALMERQEMLNVRSQDLEKVYHDVGQFYWTTTESFLGTKKLLTTNTMPMILSELEVQDIDNEVDWKLAELKYQLLSDQ